MKLLVQSLICVCSFSTVYSQNQPVILDSAYKIQSLESSKYIRVKDAGARTLIDLNHSPITSWNEPYNPSDTSKIYTITPTSWIGDQKVPVLRMRHPINTFESTETNNTSLNSDFKILPYQFGWAMEYNGVVECWVGEWSIHRGNAYIDVEGKNNGWGGVSWIGDDLDHGGVRITARNNPELAINYGEISVEKFDGSPNGNMHFRLPGISNEYKWTWGARGDSNTGMILSPQKLIVNNKIETSFIDALSIKTDTLKVGIEGNPGIQLKSYIANLPNNSTLNHLGWLQYNTAGYSNLAGSTAYFTRSDIATDHIFFTGAGTPKPSLILKGNGNLALGTYSDDYRLNVSSDNAITARFSGRVIGADAKENNEFVTLKQLRDSLNGLKNRSDNSNGKLLLSNKPKENETLPETGIEKSSFTTVDETQYGNYTASSDGKSSTFYIRHGQTTAPNWWNVMATSKDAGQISFVTADETNIIVHYQTPPAAGTSNISFNFSFRQAPVKEVKYL